MSFDKHMGKEHRKPYYGAKAVDRTCRNHGSCPYCESNRTHNNRKCLESSKDKMDCYDCVWKQAMKCSGTTLCNCWHDYNISNVPKVTPILETGSYHL